MTPAIPAAVLADAASLGRRIESAVDARWYEAKSRAEAAQRVSVAATKVADKGMGR